MVLCQTTWIIKYILLLLRHHLVMHVYITGHGIIYIRMDVMQRIKIRGKITVTYTKIISWNLFLRDIRNNYLVALVIIRLWCSELQIHKIVILYTNKYMYIHAEFRFSLQPCFGKLSRIICIKWCFWVRGTSLKWDPIQWNRVDLSVGISTSL